MMTQEIDEEWRAQRQKICDERSQYFKENNIKHPQITKKQTTFVLYLRLDTEHLMKSKIQVDQCQIIEASNVFENFARIIIRVNRKQTALMLFGNTSVLEKENGEISKGATRLSVQLLSSFNNCIMYISDHCFYKNQQAVIWQSAWKYEAERNKQIKKQTIKEQKKQTLQQKLEETPELIFQQPVGKYGYCMTEIDEQSVSNYINKCVGDCLTYGEKITVATICNRFHSTVFGRWVIHKIFLESIDRIKSQCHWQREVYYKNADFYLKKTNPQLWMWLEHEQRTLQEYRANQCFIFLSDIRDMACVFFNNKPEIFLQEYRFLYNINLPTQQWWPRYSFVYYSKSLVQSLVGQWITDVFLDGTWWAAPIKQSQLVNIIVLTNQNRKYYLMFAITNDYRTDGYRFIIDQIQQTGLDIQNAIFHCDYEWAIINAVRASGFMVQTCYFHFVKFIDQYIWGLWAFYNSKFYKDLVKKRDLYQETDGDTFEDYYENQFLDETTVSEHEINQLNDCDVASTIKYLSPTGILTFASRIMYFLPISTIELFLQTIKQYFTDDIDVAITKYLERSFLKRYPSLFNNQFIAHMTNNISENMNRQINSQFKEKQKIYSFLTTMCRFYNKQWATSDFRLFKQTSSEKRNVVIQNIQNVAKDLISATNTKEMGILLQKHFDYNSKNANILDDESCDSSMSIEQHGDQYLEQGLETTDQIVKKRYLNDIRKLYNMSQ